MSLALATVRVHCSSGVILKKGEVFRRKKPSISLIMKGDKQKMKKTFMKLLAFTLSVIMLLTSLTACGQPSKPDETTPPSAPSSDSVETTTPPAAEYPEYLNLDSAFPVIKDEYKDEITLSMVIRMDSKAKPWDEIWISKYLSDKYNITLDVEYVDSATWADRKSLMFAANELPDIMINLYMTASELVQYGVEEGQLLQMDQYMNETLTPNVLKYMTGSVKSMCTAPDGHIYTMPYLKNTAEPNNNSAARRFINNKWLQDLGIEMPRTLDEFVDALYAIKEADPAGVGSENLYPMGGGMETGATNLVLLNALGYINASLDSYGLKPALRDGEVVIPAYDMEVFQEYLKLMNQFYNDGIISPTYFTLDNTEINSMMNTGRTAMYYGAPYTPGNENWADYEAMYPLTSQWQTEPEIAEVEPASIGGFVISAETEHPELCMRIADMFFNNTDDYCSALYGGYGTDSEYSYGFLAKEYNPETKAFAVNAEKTPENMSAWNYTVMYLNGNVWNVGATQMPECIERFVAEVHGVPDHKEILDQSGKNVWRASVEKNAMPYAVEGYPSVLYASADVVEQISYLETVITPYAKEQIALFITGKRDLSELDAFKAELESMGIEELLDIYTDLYNTYKQS